MSLDLTIADKFVELFNYQYHYSLLKSGRTSGKSVVGAQKTVVDILKFPNRDIVICRCNYSDLKDSLFREILTQMRELEIENQFIVREAPLRIINKKSGNIIYFFGVGGSDTSRTRSFKPAHKLSLVVFEETQQLNRQENLEQAHASFRRYLDEQIGMFLHLFNPEPVNSHWLNVYYNMKKEDKDWLCIHTNYTDILQFITDLDLKEIRKMKLLDETRYNWMYLGETTGGFGSVYPEFNRRKHLISRVEATEKFSAYKISGIIVGVDSAVTRDKTAYVVGLILDNGQMVIASKDTFIHDPIKYGEYSSSQLMPHIMKWFNEWKSFYGVEENNIPVYFTVDSAATELLHTLRYHLPQKVGVFAFKKSSQLQMVDNIKGVLARNMVYLIDDGYHITIKGKEVSENVLAQEIETLKWKEKTDGSMPTNFDPSIPNDVSDAFKYLVNSWFTNPNNLYWQERIKKQTKEFYDL